MPRHVLIPVMGLVIFFGAQQVYADSCIFITNQQGTISSSGPNGGSNKIEIDDFSFGVEQTLTVGSQGSGAGAGKATLNPFQITKQIDSASPQLFQLAFSGETIRSITCSFYTDKNADGTGAVPYLTAVLSNATIAKFKVDGTGSGTPRLKLWFNFERVEWKL
jgi:type VI secretion system secreted protein Hcp